ncbi:MAG TPA: hypothetical protein PKM41_03330 [Deltaproteobacteria bacterium]|jgi:hypothetical protein|nr:hypothetical protein [Deltaproteobacteria bacterium]HOI08592.1 hypothetical protein [Deltaproteobacteria bacterium]
MGRLWVSAAVQRAGMCRAADGNAVAEPMIASSSLKVNQRCPCIKSCYPALSETENQNIKINLKKKKGTDQILLNLSPFWTSLF